MTISTLTAMPLAALVALHNTAVVDFAPVGFTSVKRFGSKAKAAEAIEALCAAGSLAVNFEGDSAVIVDAMGDDEGDSAEGVGNGKGAVRPWGFALSDDAWLKANPRGGEARETYRKARRKAARMARKAARAEKEAASAADAE